MRTIKRADVLKNVVETEKPANLTERAIFVLLQKVWKKLQAKYTISVEDGIEQGEACFYIKGFTPSDFTCGKYPASLEVDDSNHDEEVRYLIGVSKQTDPYTIFIMIEVGYEGDYGLDPELFDPENDSINCISKKIKKSKNTIQALEKGFDDLLLKLGRKKK